MAEFRNLPDVGQAIVVLFILAVIGIIAEVVLFGFGVYHLLNWLMN